VGLGLAISVINGGTYMSKLDLSKPIRRKSDGAKAVVIESDDGAAIAYKSPGTPSWYICYWTSAEQASREFENVPETTVRYVLAHPVGINAVNWERQAPSDNLKLTFEGERLVGAEVIGLVHDGGK
jgi:hypothetical protein